MREIATWYSPRVERNITVARWGHWGAPVLVFPTAGGDALEIERMQMIDALWPMIEAGRVKVYSVDSVAGRAWAENHPRDYCALLQNRFDSCIAEEVVPAIHQDCHGQPLEVTVAGASIGAFNAIAALCRHPDLFKTAIAMSGSYDLERLFEFQADTAFYFASPLLFVPGLQDGPQLQMLRRRFALMTFGEGRWESPAESWRMAEVLGAKGIPNRVDPWGPEWDHNWSSWRVMLPRYLEEFAHL